MSLKPGTMAAVQNVGGGTASSVPLDEVESERISRNSVELPEEAGKEAGQLQTMEIRDPAAPLQLLDDRYAHSALPGGKLLSLLLLSEGLSADLRRSRRTGDREDVQSVRLQAPS